MTTTHGTSLLTGPAQVEEQDLQEQNLQEATHLMGVEPQELAGRGLTYVHDWGNRNGQWKLRLNWGVFTRNTRVFCSIAEGAPGGGSFVGNARYTLHNCAVDDGGATIWVNIEWGSPIRLTATYFIVNP
jgi:hypothetical protein